MEPDRTAASAAKAESAPIGADDIERRLLALEEWIRCREIGHVEGRLLEFGRWVPDLNNGGRKLARSDKQPLTLDEIHDREQAVREPPAVPLQPGDPGFFV